MMKQAGIDMGDFEAENQDPELAALEKLYKKSKMVNIFNFYRYEWKLFRRRDGRWCTFGRIRRSWWRI